MPRAVLFACAVAATGCLQVATAGLQGVGGPGVAGGVYNGSECSEAPDGREIRREGYGGPNRRIWQSYTSRELSQPVGEQILRLICVHEIRAGDAIREQHASFDDRRFDHLAAALIVVECDVSGLCAESPVALGMMEWYVTHTRLDALKARLAGVILSDGAKAAFVKRVAQAHERLMAKIAELDPRRRHLYVAVPNAVRAARQDYFERHADLYRRLDPLLEHAAAARQAQQVTPAILDALVGVREAYLDGCRGAECRYDAFFTEVTRELILCHLVARDPVGALAEAWLLQADGANRNGYGAAIRRAQYQAMSDEYEAWQKYERAKREGLDETALIATFGETPPIQVTPDSAWYASDDFPDYAAAVRAGRYETMSVSVKGVANQRDKLTSKVTLDDSRLPFVIAPRVEAARLRAGDEVLLIVDEETQQARVCQVRARGKVVQLRSHRVR